MTVGQFVENQKSMSLESWLDVIKKYGLCRFAKYILISAMYKGKITDIKNKRKGGKKCH